MAEISKKKFNNSESVSPTFNNLKELLLKNLKERIVTVVITALFSIVFTIATFYSVLYSLPQQVLALQGDVSILQEFMQSQRVFNEKQVIINEKITNIEGSVNKIYDYLINK